MRGLDVRLDLDASGLLIRDVPGRHPRSGCDADPDVSVDFRSPSPDRPL
jgi:hypothetical protein